MILHHLNGTRSDVIHTLLRFAEASPHGVELTTKAREQLADHLDEPAAARAVWLSGAVLRACALRLVERV